MADMTPMPMCPLAKTCKGMMEKRFSSVMLVVPGLVFIALGIVVVLEPRILAWFIAAAFVLFGLMLLGMARFVRRVGLRVRDTRE